MNMMAVLAKLPAEFSHGSEKRQHLLNMEYDIIGFLAEFHHDIKHIRIDHFKPGVMDIGLIAENETDDFGLRNHAGFAAGFEK